MYLRPHPRRRIALKTTGFAWLLVAGFTPLQAQNGGAFLFGRTRVEDLPTIRPLFDTIIQSADVPWEAVVKPRTASSTQRARLTVARDTETLASFLSSPWLDRETRFCVSQPVAFATGC